MLSASSRSLPFYGNEWCWKIIDFNWKCNNDCKLKGYMFWKPIGRTNGSREDLRPKGWAWIKQSQ